MTFRLYDELDSELYQDFNFELEKRHIIKGFYPYLYLKNAPSGTFTFEIYAGEIKVFSKAFTASDIKAAMSTSENSAYVFYPVLADPYLILGKGTYRAMIKSSGYLPNENAHLGWIRAHRYLVNELNFEINDESQTPFSLKIKVLEKADI